MRIMGIYEKNNCRILGKGQWISNDDIKSARTIVVAGKRGLE